MESPAELVSALQKGFSAHPEVEVALLYGLRIPAACWPPWNLDLAVDEADIGLLGVIRDVTLATRLEVAVVDLRVEGHPFPLLQILLRKGVVVYEGSRHAAARWRTQAALRWKTSAPTGS